MPIQHAIWKVGAQPAQLSTSRLANEQLLEEMISRDPRILSNEWMLIGRQETTPFAGRIDLLAIGPDGSLVLIELKRDRTPREIVAQALDYAAWVENLTADQISQIYHRFSEGGNLAEAFKKRFGSAFDEETLNESHQIVIVAAELDNASERIIQYLNDRDISINVLFFQVFQNGADQFLSRAWLIEPNETALQNSAVAANGTSSKKKRQWDESSFFAELESKAGPKQSQTARRIFDWARVNVTRMWWGQGLHSGSFIPVIEEGSVKQFLFAVFTGAPKSRATIMLYFAYWAKRAPFDNLGLRLEMMTRLNAIPGIAIPPTSVDKWPTIPLEVLVDDIALQKFLATFEWFIARTRQLTPVADALV